MGDSLRRGPCCIMHEQVLIASLLAAFPMPVKQHVCVLCVKRATIIETVNDGRHVWLIVSGHSVANTCTRKLTEYSPVLSVMPCSSDLIRNLTRAVVGHPLAMFMPGAQ